MNRLARLINKMFGWEKPSRIMMEIGKFNPTTFERGETMDNQKILNQAIELLSGLDLKDSESVQINHTKYDDGSRLFEVGVSYPALVTSEDND